MSFFWLDPWERSEESKPQLTEVMCGYCKEILAYRDEGGDICSRIIGVEYPGGTKDHYDGVSEWRCPNCGIRVGRWSGTCSRRRRNRAALRRKT